VQYLWQGSAAGLSPHMNGKQQVASRLLLAGTFQMPRQDVSTEQKNTPHLFPNTLG